MLTAAVLSLEPVGEASLPASHGGMAFAAALDLFLRLDPALSRRLHDAKEIKPFTVGPLEGPFQRNEGLLHLSPAERCHWRLTGLSEEVSAGLQKLSPTIGGVRFGDAVFRIAEVAFRGEDHPAAGQERCVDLVRRIQQRKPEPVITLNLVSPTTFRQGTIEQPFPLPRLVWGSLLARWNRWSALPHQEAAIQDLLPLLEEAVVLTNWKGETRRVELGSRRTVGFVGRFSYRVLEAQRELGPLLMLLAEFAFYAGVGWQTTHGLGQARSVR